MKYTSVLLTLLAAVFLPGAAWAHGMIDFNSTYTGPQMMQYLEDQALQNDELHEEMEDLMVKMMTGELTEEEANRMVALMNEYPGPMGMMMNRYDMMGTNTGQNGYGMMNWNYDGPGVGNALAWLMLLPFVIWLIVGVLVIVWLWKQIQKK